MAQSSTLWTRNALLPESREYLHRLPRGGAKPEWRHNQDYWAERVEIPVIDLDGAERLLRIPTHITSFALPFGVSVLRANAGVSWIVSALFIAKLYGVHLEFPQIAVFTATSVAMSFSVPGIPSGGLFIIAPAFMTVGLPIEGVGILIALDAIPDIFKTSVNVTAHMTATVLLARGERGVVGGTSESTRVLAE
jgi:Na+/H+-dicarboxylate symporter